MQQINLYQEQFKPRRQLSVTLLIASLLGTMLIAMALLGWYQHHDRQQLQQHLIRAQKDNQQLLDAVAELEHKLEQRHPSPLLQHKLLKLQEQLRQRQPLRQALRRELAQHTTIPQSLRALAKRPLPQLWLNRIELLNGGAQVRLQGITVQAKNVPVFIDQLASQGFSRRRFSQLQLQQQKDGLYQFILSTVRESGQ